MLPKYLSNNVDKMSYLVLFAPIYLQPPLPQLTIFVFHHEYPPLPIYHNPTSQFNFTSKISKPPTITARGILGCCLMCSLAAQDRTGIVISVGPVVQIVITHIFLLLSRVL